MDIATEIRLIFLIGLGVVVGVFVLIGLLVQLTGGIARPIDGRLTRATPGEE